MPEICRFFGIVIRMYLSDHAPPHFHAIYQDYEVMIDIAEGNILHGALPRKELRLVLAWLELHRDELIENWQLASDRLGELKKIPPLE
jgi:hypothetical protein